MSNRTIYWFRNDLRLHDNEGFLKASQRPGEIIPVYVFDPRIFELSPLGFRKTGIFKTRFLLESVEDLRRSLQAKGADLLIRFGEPEKVLAELAQQYDVSEIHLSKEVAQEETDVESSLSKRLKILNVDMVFTWMATLYHVRDLPFGFNKLPNVFTDFRKSVEKNTSVRPTLAEPSALNLPEEFVPGEIPSFQTLGYEETELIQADGRGVLDFKGGETAGLQRLHAYLWETQNLATYKTTRNGLLGADYSSKFSAWLAVGCLSPRKVYEEVKRFETEIIVNDSTYWLIFELLWRDYFRFVMLRWGTRLFKPSGLKLDKDKTWKQDKALFERWTSGQTGVPFVDANMRELNATGFMSNRGRQNVASFLAHDLGIDWTWGAAYFESLLLDYDVCSNWGNWNYIAGVGNDPRENRYFNTYSQATRYDPDGAYLRHWLPELAEVPADRLNKVWQLSKSEQETYGVSLGSTYPLPIIPADKWL
ncbi:DASH family cryptochrome [Arundinibacter roseus]|uniref:Cryptochrome DASH n=1 Tax=Arundinibacter roseus TaxID=2070510 RepID=A0A4R4KPM2_9BACT|nr:DASH family cryptochrome [Arundinibacter roseus]TDB68822.1 DASH family cryptochrome [Arundinibacter roseus]